MTAEKFMLNPFSDEPGARLYKTGDLVRYRADGNIEFLGRVDQQVKVRGFRIELGEIESMLRQHPAVREGVVLAREDVSGDKRLVAYVVPNNGRQTKTDETPGQASSTVAQPASLVGEMKGFLKQHLPEYMLPSIFVVLDALPLSPSGKVDRRALPAPDSARPDLERAYAAPRTPTEETLAAICAELLAIDQVGIYDNFFDLGGHSLLATQFISRLRDSFHVELALRSLFETPTVAELARKIDEALPSQPKDMDKIAEMLKRLDQLSEADVRTMLEATGHRQAE
jgi:acyl carrier protein